MLRLQPGLHGTLHGATKSTGLSLNEYSARKLASPTPPLTDPRVRTAVEAAARVGGERLLGVVAFGSWARQEQGRGSDIDLLVVLEETLPITRRLYPEWDEEPLSSNGHPVEPHFVHLLPADRLVLGLWAEVAIDGPVLFERDLQVSRRLGRVRDDIARGRILRREAHGHPYRVEAA